MKVPWKQEAHAIRPETMAVSALFTLPIQLEPVRNPEQILGGNTHLLHSKLHACHTRGAAPHIATRVAGMQLGMHFEPDTSLPTAAQVVANNMLVSDGSGWRCHGWRCSAIAN